MQEEDRPLTHRPDDVPRDMLWNLARCEGVPVFKRHVDGRRRKQAEPNIRKAELLRHFPDVCDDDIEFKEVLVQHFCLRKGVL